MFRMHGGSALVEMEQPSSYDMGTAADFFITLTPSPSSSKSERELRERDDASIVCVSDVALKQDAAR